MKDLIKVVVQKDYKDPKGIVYPMRYDCPLDDGWLCGACLKGNLGINPQKGDICDNCKAKVCDAIEDRPEYHKITKACAMCHQEMEEDEKIEHHYKENCLSFDSKEKRLRIIEETLGLR